MYLPETLPRLRVILENVVPPRIDIYGHSLELQISAPRQNLYVKRPTGCPAIFYQRSGDRLPDLFLKSNPIINVGCLHVIQHQIVAFSGGISYRGAILEEAARDYRGEGIPTINELLPSHCEPRSFQCPVQYRRTEGLGGRGGI